MEQSDKYIGKHVLIGVTYLDHEENFIEQKQFHGTIVRVNQYEGIVVKLEPSGEEFKLPPDFNSLQAVPDGEFRLHSTGAIVVDPDYVTTWTLTKPNLERLKTM